MVWRFITGKGRRNEQQEHEPVRTDAPVRKLINPTEHTPGDIGVEITSPSVRHTLQLIARHQQLHKGPVRNFHPHDSLHRLFAGADISDVFVAGQIGGELAEGFAPAGSQLTGLEGYILGLPLEQHAEAVLSFGATVKDTIDRRPELKAGLVNEENVSAAIPGYRQPLEKLLGARWRLAMELRSKISAFGADVRRTSRVGFDPHSVSVNVREDAPEARRLSYSGVEEQLGAGQIPGRSLLETSQIHYILQIGAYNQSSSEWQDAISRYPEEMRYASLAGHMDAAAIDVIVQNYMGAANIRLY